MANFDDARVQLNANAIAMRDLVADYPAVVYDPDIEIPVGQPVGIEQWYKMLVYYNEKIAGNFAQKADLDGFWDDISQNVPSVFTTLYRECTSLPTDLSTYLPVMDGFPCTLHTNFIPTIVSYDTQYHNASSSEEQQQIAEAAQSANDSYIRNNFYDDVDTAIGEYRAIITNDGNSKRYSYYFWLAGVYSSKYIPRKIKEFALQKKPLPRESGAQSVSRPPLIPFRNGIEQLDFSGCCYFGDFPPSSNFPFYHYSATYYAYGDAIEPSAWGDWECDDKGTPSASSFDEFELYYGNTILWYDEFSSFKTKRSHTFINPNAHLKLTLYYVYYSTETAPISGGFKYYPLYGFQKVEVPPMSEVTLDPEGDDSPMQAQVEYLESLGLTRIYETTIKLIFEDIIDDCIPLSIYLQYKLAYYTIEKVDGEEE